MLRPPQGLAPHVERPWHLAQGAHELPHRVTQHPHRHCPSCLLPACAGTPCVAVALHLCQAHQGRELEGPVHLLTMLARPVVHLQSSSSSRLMPLRKLLGHTLLHLVPDCLAAAAAECQGQEQAPHLLNGVRPGWKPHRRWPGAWARLRLVTPGARRRMHAWSACLVVMLLLPLLLEVGQQLVRQTWLMPVKGLRLLQGW